MKFKKEILDFIKFYSKKQKKFNKINNEFEKFEFSSFKKFNLIDSEIEERLFHLLDTILGDQIASYFLFCSNQKGGGILEVGSTKYQIKNLNDLENYFNKEL